MNKPYAAVVFLFLALVSFALAAEPSQQQTRAEGQVLTLEDAVRMALAHSPDVLLAKVQALQAGEALQETRALNRPQVVVGTGLAYNNGFPLSIEGAAPSIIQAGVSQAIFSKKNRNLILEAEQSNKASRIGPESARNDLAARVALVYNEVHQARKAGALWPERLSALQSVQQVFQNLLQAGRARPLDVTLAKTAAAEAQQQLLAAQEHVRLAEVELRQLTDLPEGSEIRTTEPNVEDQLLDLPADTLFQRALEIHPEILQAQTILRAREFHVQAERGEKYPQLLLVSQYAVFSRTNNYQDFFKTFTRNNFLFGLSLQFPVFNGFRTEARIAQSRQEMEAARLQLERLKSNLKLNIERGASALKLAKGALELARQAVAAARETLQVDETMLEAGRIGFKELEASRSQLVEKQISEIDAGRILFQRKIELLRATGGIGQAFAH